MTTEELLRPRYKVIADYPSSAFSVGHILNGTCEYLVKGEGFCNDGYMQEYPHLFKKLEWWEEREEKDMPEYLKLINNGRIIKINSYDFITNTIYIENIIGEEMCPLTLTTYLISKVPATKEEYENQNNK